MSLLSMRFVPDGVLREKAKKIGKIPPTMRKYTDDMVETMHAEEGVGLAANQVGSLQKVAVIQLPDWDEPLVLINPEITRREGEREVERRARSRVRHGAEDGVAGSGEQQLGRGVPEP